MTLLPLVETKHLAHGGGQGRCLLESVSGCLLELCGSGAERPPCTASAACREGHKNDPRAGAPLLRGKAERVGAVQPRESYRETL